MDILLFLYHPKNEKHRLEKLQPFGGETFSSRCLLIAFRFHPMRSIPKKSPKLFLDIFISANREKQFLSFRVSFREIDAIV